MDNTQPRRSSRLLIDEYPLQVLPSLACAIGLNEAMFLQQVHYWISRPEAHVRDGRRWVYNSYPDWQKQFPFWGVNTIRRTIETLETRGLLLTGNYNESKIDRTKWYSIDYDALNALPTSDWVDPFAENHRPSAQNGQTISPEWADHPPTMGRPIPETNTETNNREKETAPASGTIAPSPPDSFDALPPHRGSIHHPDTPRGQLRAVPKASSEPDRVRAFEQTLAAYPCRRNIPPNRETAEPAFLIVPREEWAACAIGAGHYARSADVQDGIVMDMAKWLLQKEWRRWQHPEAPKGKAVATVTGQQYRVVGRGA